MEAALSTPFFESTILFSLTSKYEKSLKRELWLCHRNMNLSMDDILNMPIADRHDYIVIHNNACKKEKEEFEAAKKAAKSRKR